MKLVLLILALFVVTSAAPLAAKVDKPRDAVIAMLQHKAVGMQPAVIDKVHKALQCAKKNNVEHNNILTVIDFSQPSSKKRLWVFDIPKRKLLFHTYVSHGIKSGSYNSTYFSNKNNSKASSIGVFNTEKKYRGRYGVSLKLLGLEDDINHNAYSRFIVMHGSWYVNEKFINKYGRAGRSWGCPSLPLNLVKPIINTIKDNALLVAYYPSDAWIAKSKFINCDESPANATQSKPLVKQEEDRGEIIFADLNNNDKRDRTEPIVVVSANHYQQLFNKTPPLKRMLRRQINKQEYIALNNTEFNSLDSNKDKALSAKDKQGLRQVYFVTPEVKKVRGYYATEMKITNLGKVKKIKLQPMYVVTFQKKPSIYLKETNRFIRWLGL
ncbi:MAG: murein L,D-transpeptidase catalytic domain family protein [Coxiellaceae bacterium]|nr:murein L,D-transpeptidase catalytic domain family protein [Coxiellaceae bacterium]